VFATQTQHTLKRIGDNTTNVDMAGDTKFRFPGVPDGCMVPAAINSRVQAPVMPGGISQGRRWDWQVETVTSSKFFALSCVPSGATPEFLIVVNGKWISTAKTVVPMVSGSLGFLMLEFPDNRPRRIKIITQGACQILNFQTEAAYPPARPVGNDKVLLSVGDSLTVGANGVGSLETWPQGAAAMLGFDHCCNAAIGGTRWVQSGTGDVAISHFGGDRLPLALTTANIAAAVFAGSRNDAGGNQAQLDAITAAVGAAMDITPIAKRFIAGTFTVLPQNPAVQAGALAKGVTFIDMQDGLQPEDISNDAVHPTLQGAINLRNRFVPRLLAAGCVP